MPSRILPPFPNYDLKGHLAYVRDLHEKYPLNTAEKCKAHTLELIKRIGIPWGILDQFENLIIDIYLVEEIYCDTPPTIEDREYLTRRQAELSAERIKAADDITARYFKALFAQLPASVFEKEAPTGPSVPLHAMTKELPEAINAIIAAFRHETFPRLAERLAENIMRVSGIDPNKPSTRKFVMPLEHDDQGAFIKRTPFEAFFNAQVPFAIPRKTWASHGIILAPPNHGKTQLLGSLIASFLNDDDSPGLFVLDPHGDLYASLVSRCEPSRVVCLDPDTAPPPLNFLDFGTSTEAQTLQTFSYLMSSLSGGLSDKQGAIVPYLLKLLRRIPDASLETLRTIVDEKVKVVANSKYFSAISTLPDVDQGFFHNQFYSARMQETKDSIGWKLYSALSSDAFRQMFSASHNSFDASAAMAERKVVLVKGARQSLGDHGMQVFLQFIVAQFFSAALRRERLPSEDRHLGVLCIDEAHHVFNSQTANILTECRKYGLGFLAATQVVQQIPEDVKAAIYGATAIKIAGPVSHSDAQILSREMYTTGDFIRSMKAVERSHADWAMYVSGMTDKAVRVRVPYGSLEAMPKQNHFADVSKGVAPQTHEGPSKPEPPSANQITLPAEADPPIISDDDITIAGPGGWKK